MFRKKTRARISTPFWMLGLSAQGSGGRRRQVLNFALPGDLVGLQLAVLNEMQHTVTALTDTTLCVFQRDRVWSIFKDYPSLAFSMTWIAAREEQILDGHIISLGQRSAWNGSPISSCIFTTAQRQSAMRAIRRWMHRFPKATCLMRLASHRFTPAARSASFRKRG